MQLASHVQARAAAAAIMLLACQTVADLACSPAGVQKLLRVHSVNGSSIPKSATSLLMLLYCHQNLRSM